MCAWLAHFVDTEGAESGFAGCKIMLQRERGEEEEETDPALLPPSCPVSDFIPSLPGASLSPRCLWCGQIPQRTWCRWV